MRFERLTAHSAACFLTEHDIFSGEEIRHQRATTLGAMELGWYASAAFEVSTGEIYAFFLERSLTQGPFPNDILAILAEIWPHLARTVKYSTQRSRRHINLAVRVLEGWACCGDP